MKEQINRLIKWRNGEKIGPYSIEIHPTNLCNLQCRMCGTQIEHARLMKENQNFHPSLYKKFELKRKKVIELIREAYALKADKFLITGGGEPFVRKDDTLSFMNEIKRYGMFGNINTNGALLNKNDVEKIILMDWDMVMLSIDSQIPAIHDFIRGKNGTFNRVRKVLLDFQNTKRKYGSDKPRIVFNTVLCNKNFNHLHDFIIFASEMDCEDITFIPLIEFDELNELKIDGKEYSHFLKEIPHLIKCSTSHGIHTNLSSFIRETRTVKKSSLVQKKFYNLPCFEPFLNLVIKMDGKYSPCCMIQNYKDSIKDKSLREIWFGDYFKSMRSSFTKFIVPRDCSYCVHMQQTQNNMLREELRKQI